MLSIEEIDKTILDLENHDTTYSTCEKLAWLYIVRDHLVEKNPQVVYSSKTPTVDEGSEFRKVTSNMEIDDLMSVMDEHMEVVSILHPKEYESIMERLYSFK